jgi:phosphatidylglycerophosphate synthase
VTSLLDSFVNGVALLNDLARNKAGMTDRRKVILKPIDRSQQNFLAKSERRLLTWLCKKMPRWVTPDMLTATGVTGAGIIFIGYASSAINSSWLWLAIAGYFLHWFGDSMDGSLARFRQIERPAFGYFIDHSCDGFATFLIVAGMGLSPYVRLDAALFALVGYLLLFVHAVLAVRVLGELKLSYMAAGPTELRLPDRSHTRDVDAR